MTPLLVAYGVGVLAAALHSCREDLEAWPFADRLQAIALWPCTAAAYLLVRAVMGPSAVAAAPDEPTIQRRS